jgi:hypothetical protein
MYRSKTHLLALLLAIAAVTSAVGCASGARPAPAAPADARVDEFFAHVRSDTDHAWLEESSDAWLTELPAGTRIQIAERALGDPDPAVQLSGPLQFYALGMDERGDAAMAKLAVQGVDLTGVAWGWLHSGDAGLMGRRMAGIRRALIADYEQMTAEQRLRAEAILCEEGQPCDLNAWSHIVP